MHNQAPIIELKPELRSQLEQKLLEYHKRLDEKVNSGYQPPEQYGEWYNIQVLESLLNNGSVNTYELSREIAAAHDGGIPKLHLFENACAVIDAYASGKVAIGFRAGL